MIISGCLILLKTGKEGMCNIRKVKLDVIDDGCFSQCDICVHQFDRNWIKQVVTEDIKKGNYRIGLVDDHDVFHVKYVGRSTDQILQTRILQHTDDYDDNYYFEFKSASSDYVAVMRECIDFHSFGGSDYLDNDIHPALPEGMECPWPGCGRKG